MTRQQFGQWAFAIGMIGFGILTVSTGDFVAPWEAVPAWVPARTVLVYVCGALMVGTGVGLYLVKMAVELHRGSVAVQSREGEGSRFTIRLPRKSLPSHAPGSIKDRSRTDSAAMTEA